MHTFTRTCLLYLILLLPAAAHSQTDSADNSLSAMLENNEVTGKSYTTATFKTTRLINGHSIENTGKGILDFKISHRFTSLSGGVHDFFGLDGATLRLGLDYGLTDWLTAGVGRSSLYKEYDGYIKLRILRQTDNGGMPLSVSYVGAMSLTSLPDNQLLGRPLVAPEKYPFSNRLFYTNQLLIARKFSQSLSLQLMPTHVHYNFVNTRDEPNDVLALGVGGRIKLSRRISFNVEYYYQLAGNQLAGTTNSLSAGFDIETGGHVFQLHFTNSSGMTERTFIGQTTDKWEDGGIRFGFNIARVFTIVKPKGFENSRNKIW
jgi:hypothetical protein